MKKVFLIMSFAFALCFGANAQVGSLTWSGNSGTLDTVTNSGTRTATVSITKPAYGFNFVLKVLKISGTVGGTISFQGSNNGTDYANLSTTSASDASANYTYSVLSNPNYRYYRISWTGTGTMAASVQGTYYIVR